MRHVPIDSSPRRWLVPALLALALAGPRAVSAAGTPSPSPMPPSNPVPSSPAQQPMSPDEKAAQDRRDAEGLYADGYEECEKAKLEQAEADSLSQLTDAKSAEKAKKKSESARKRLSKQIDKFERATTLDPKYHEAWNMLGFCLRKTGDTQKALQAYWECLRLAPEYAPAHEYLGEAYLMAGNLEKAQAELAWLKERDPKLAASLEKQIARYAANSKPAQPTATGSN